MRPARVPYPAWDDWLAQRAGALENGAAPRVWSATAIATAAAERAARADPGLAKDARDLELPPWNKGRYGTAVGSAVHAVLQTVDLVSGHDVDATAAAQAAAEGVIGRERDIAALTRSALASRTVREAVATNDYRREMYVATQVEGHTLEGYVDLVYRTSDGSGRRRLQDRRLARRVRSRGQGRALPAPGSVVRARARGGHR